MIEVRVRDADTADRAVAEAHAAGAAGVEEREEGEGRTLLLYATAARADRVREAVVAAVGPGARVAAPAAVPETDWSERWKQGLEPVVVSRRLVVRPSFLSVAPQPGRLELEIDPGQAFGTGGHASTRLALEWIDARAPRLAPGARILDVGTGTGVLALAALGLSEARAVAFDLDPLATEAARENALRNGLLGRLDLFTGPLSALCGTFDLIVANLLRTELFPLLAGLAARLAQEGEAILSGLLADERATVEATLGEVGLEVVALRRGEDERSDAWIALLTRHRRARASR